MKKIILTDTSALLNQTLLHQYNIYEIPTSKSPIGQILYTLDIFATMGYSIIYLSNDELFASIIKLAESICNIHPLFDIKVINIESSNIGKNNLSLKIASSSFEDVIKTYPLTYKCIESTFTYELDLAERALLSN